MSRRPNVPCAGSCGSLLWGGGTGSLPPGQRKCRACRMATYEPPAPNAQCASCGTGFRSVRRSCGELTKTCSKACAQRRRERVALPRNCLDCGVGVIFPALRCIPCRTTWSRARARMKTYRRKAMVAAGDFTLADDIAMRARTKNCCLCQVRLVDAPYLPASKELDHIVPRNVGGTHTHGNVRIICRQCNQKRPNDGSDYVGPVTLWAEVS